MILPVIIVNFGRIEITELRKYLITVWMISEEYSLLPHWFQLGSGIRNFEASLSVYKIRRSVDMKAIFLGAVKYRYYI